jgi:hypothetical protein
LKRRIPISTAASRAGQRPQGPVAAAGTEIAGGTPEQFSALIRAEAPRWGKVVKDAKIEPE